MLLCTIANGKHVGAPGSFCCAPKSANDDGLMEVSMVRAISRLRFASLLGPYAKGEHFGNPKFEDCVVHLRGKEAEIEAPEGFRLSLDGEMAGMSKVTVKILPRALDFVAPKGL
jgi:diacylglycerol kinase (ATP)